MNTVIDKKQLHKFFWSAGNAIMITLTFALGSWFVLFASMFSFMMGVQFCKNNWIVGMKKVVVTEQTVKKRD